MSDLLTPQEYRPSPGLTLAAHRFHRRQIPRRPRAKDLTTINPATGETLAEIAACNSEDVDLAVQKAREAFDQGHWSKSASSRNARTF